jgi:glycosyltransferase involved in cell wall biosynthesis
MKPLILVFASLYRPFIGGAELAVENISKHLIDDFDIYIITAKMSSGLKGREKTPEGTVIRLGVGIRFDKFLLPILSFVWVLRYLSSLRFVDESSVSRKVVFWGMMVSYASIGAWFLKWVYPKIPFLLTVQEGDEEWKFKWKNLGMSALWWKLIFKKATHVTAISRYLLEVVREHGYEGQAEAVQ